MAKDKFLSIQIERQKSLNWCWLAVTLAVAKLIDSACGWTQERILFEAAKLGKQQNKAKWDQDRIDTIQYSLLKDDGSPVFSDSAKLMSLTDSDWRGPLELSMGAIGCWGERHKISDFPIAQKDWFEFVVSEIDLGRPLVATLTFNQSMGSAAGIGHALLVVGYKVEDDQSRHIYWMDPDPQKTLLGTLNCVPLADFEKLQGKADLTALSTTKSSVKACPMFQRVS